MRMEPPALWDRWDPLTIELPRLRWRAELQVQRICYLYGRHNILMLFDISHQHVSFVLVSIGRLWMGIHDSIQTQTTHSWTHWGTTVHCKFILFYIIEICLGNSKYSRQVTRPGIPQTAKANSCGSNNTIFCVILCSRYVWTFFHLIFRDLTLLDRETSYY